MIIRRFTRNPERIEGNRIILRKAQLSDSEVIYQRVWSDTILASAMFWPASTSWEEVPERMQKTIREQKKKPEFFIIEKATDEVIGMTGIQRESFTTYSETGIAIAKTYQGQGYGKETLQLLLDLAFGHYHAKRFAYYCMTHNTISQNLAKSFGFVHERTYMEVRPHDKKEVELYRYILERTDYIKYVKEA